MNRGIVLCIGLTTTSVFGFCSIVLGCAFLFCNA
jgi:hypothetical protein